MPRWPSTTPTSSRRPSARPRRCSTPSCRSGCPELKGWDVATLYQPSGRVEVGGDFFDVIDLTTDRYVAVIGDVMGRGVDAAATAARLQAAVRALVAADPDLSAVAAGLDRLLELSSEQPLVTLVLLAFDGATDSRRRARRRAPRRRCWSAPTAPPSRWQGTVWPAFGVGAVDRHPDPVDLPRGGVVLLYTDGLVERRDEDLDAGVDRLTAVLRHSVRRGPRPPAYLPRTGRADGFAGSDRRATTTTWPCWRSAACE